MGKYKAQPEGSGGNRKGESVIREQKSFFGLTKRSLGFLCRGAFLSVGALFLILVIIIEIQKWLQKDQLKREGQVIPGMVLAKEIRQGQKSNILYYWVGYSFKTPEWGTKGDSLTVLFN